MTLPTLNSYSESKRLIMPQQINLQQNENESGKKTEMIEINNKSKVSIRNSSARSKWASPISGILCDEALRNEQEAKEKSSRLEQRRTHLNSLLENEKNQYQNELTTRRQSSRDKTPRIKVSFDSCRSTDDNQQNSKKNETFDESFQNNSHSSAIDENKFENLRLNDSLDEFNYEENHSQYRDSSEQSKTDKRIRRIEQLKLILQEQMNEIKQKEEECESLKQQEKQLHQQQDELDQFENERKQMEKPPNQQENGRQLLRQHKAKLHKRTKEIQEEIEFDINLLTKMIQSDQQNCFDEQEQFKRSSYNVLKQFQQQLQREKSKEQEFDSMFQDDAAKQWSRYEQEWLQEKELRNKQFQQVFDQRHEFILNQLKSLRKKREELDDQQRQLIRDMEKAREYNLIEKQKYDKELNEFNQIKLINREHINLPIQSDKQDSVEGEDTTTKGRTSQIKVEPKFYGRRRVNWN